MRHYTLYGIDWHRRRFQEGEAELSVWRRWCSGKVQRLASEEATWLENGSCLRTI